MDIALHQCIEARYRLKQSYSNEDRMNVRVIETKQLHKLDIDITLGKWEPTHLDGREYTSLLQDVSNDPSTIRT